MKRIREKRIIHLTILGAIIFVAIICFYLGKSHCEIKNNLQSISIQRFVSVDDVKKVKSIQELRNYIGIKDWKINKAILEKLDQFKNEDEIDEKVEILYLLYIQEETEENNKIEYIGGHPPWHIEIQSEVLDKLRQLPLEKVQEKILKIVDKYLVSIERMDYHTWRISPKQALQIDMAVLLGAFIEDNSIRKMGYRYLNSPTVGEYAKAYLVIPLLEYKVSKIPEQEDIEGTKRIEIILEMAVKPELREMLHSPRRLRGCAKILEKVLKNDLSKLDIFIEARPELGQSEKYFLYSFIARYLLLGKLNKGLQLSADDMNRLNKAVDFWGEIYPNLLKEKYADDVLSEVTSIIGEKIDNETLKKKIIDYKNRSVESMKKQ